jgi:hypothetical protein
MPLHDTHFGRLIKLSMISQLENPAGCVSVA